MKKVIQPETRDNVFPDHKFVSNKNQLKAAVTTFVEKNAVEWEKVKILDLGLILDMSSPKIGISVHEEMM